MDLKIAAATQRTTECGEDIINISGTINKMDHAPDVVNKPPYDPNDNNLSLSIVEDVVELYDGNNAGNNATKSNTKSLLMTNQVGMEIETGTSPSSEPTSPLQFYGQGHNVHHTVDSNVIAHGDVVELDDDDNADNNTTEPSKKPPLMKIKLACKQRQEHHLLPNPLPHF